jgi:8-oxo-dGTP pyrophosphatase MutT (NUDIX family)
VIAPRIDTELVRRALCGPGTVLDTAWIASAAPAPAAVLLAMRLDTPVPSVVAMLRAGDLRDHSNEVAFPGGKPEEGDASLLATALRESREEVGLGADDVDFVGMLSAIPVITGKYLIHPHVAVVHAGRAPQLGSAHEVARVLELPLTEWLTGALRWEAVKLDWRGAELLMPHFPLGDITLFGASAFIYHDLLRRLALALGQPLPEPLIRETYPWGDRYAKHRGGP